MDRCEPIDSLDLDDYNLFYEQIETIDGAEWLFLVLERYDKLS